MTREDYLETLSAVTEIRDSLKRGNMLRNHLKDKYPTDELAKAGLSDAEIKQLESIGNEIEELWRDE